MKKLILSVSVVLLLFCTFFIFCKKGYEKSSTTSALVPSKLSKRKEAENKEIKHTDGKSGSQILSPVQNRRQSAKTIKEDDDEKKPFESEQGSKENPFAAIEWRYNMLSGNDASIDLVKKRSEAIEFTKNKVDSKNILSKASSLQWGAAGPGNVGGRIRSIIVKPDNPLNILIGAVAGGVWKSTNGGDTWFPTMDDKNPIAIGSMVEDPNNPSIVYAGSGEGWGNIDAVYGGGIYKSTDFGSSWNILPSTSGSSTALLNFRNIMKLTFDPSGNLYAATRSWQRKDGLGGYYTNGGLYRSADAGLSWSKISPGNPPSSRYYDPTDVVAFSSSRILYATNYGDGIFLTTDGGTNWTKLTSNLPSTGIGRIVLTQDPTNSNTVYAAFESTDISSSGDGGLKGIYKSTDAGSSWTVLNRPGKLNSTGGCSYLGSQGWYDNVLSIDPNNSNNIFVAGVEMMNSADGGNTWKQTTVWHSYYNSTLPVVHSDHHAICFVSSQPGVIYDGNDGGIYKSTNYGQSWTSKNNGLEITQFYSGAAFAKGNTIHGGTQDNGHLKYSGTGTNWNEVYGGDGGYSAQDQINSQVAYEEYVYLDMSKTTDGGISWNSCLNGLSDANNSSRCLFIAPFAINPDNSNILIAGSDRVWITVNGAGQWSSSSGVLSSGQKISAVTLVNSTANYLGFAGTTDGKIFRCINLGSGADMWNEVTPSGQNGAWVRRIVIDPNNKNSIYACYSGYNNTSPEQSRHIWHSIDQGASWTDISTNLPNVPVHSLVIDNIHSALYIGTETGVYSSNNQGSTWLSDVAGMPSYVPVDELVLQSGSGYMYAFTHGRSVFKTTNPLPVELTVFSAKAKENSVMLNWETSNEIGNLGFDIERRYKEDDKSPWKKVGFISGSGNSNSPKYYSFTDNSIMDQGKYTYRLKQMDTDGNFRYSGEVEVEVVFTDKKYHLEQNYPNPFNPVTKIRYYLPFESQVELNVYNSIGEIVSQIINEHEPAGYKEVTFNGSNLSSGVYIYTLKAKAAETGKEFIEKKKFVLVK